ncbi:MAG: hypothetical protein K9N05_06115 [Candidatus Marinimicrobia bacterium]|nr:hypothetical protein [Candidatus Neomarinimicrobiota bacterium]
MKKFLAIVLITLTLTTIAIAQDSKFDAGLRLGIMNNFGGISARYSLSETSKVEALVSTPGFNGVIFTGMYQIHKQIGDVEDLSWYFGGGIHLGNWKGATSTWNGSTWVSRDFALGLDAIIGVQYNMGSLINFPLLLSLDYKPAYDIFGYWATNWGGVALSIRYAL